MLFTMRKRISKTLPATTVLDSWALGKMYASRVSLARFEGDGGQPTEATCVWS